MLHQLNLNALLTAVSVSKSGSVSQAAEDQMLTPSAVSQRLITLERQLKFRIFNRSSGGMTLTVKGRDFIHSAERALEEVERAVAAGRSEREERVRIHAPPTLAQRWLMPRLKLFRDLNPSYWIDLSVHSSPTSPVAEECDLSLSYGRRMSHGLVTKLTNSPIIPVCTRPVLDSISDVRGSNSAPLDILRRTALLCSKTCVNEWRSWLRAQSAEELLNDVDILHFDDCLMCLEAAEQGLGMAIVSKIHVMEELRTKRLVAPFGAKISHDGSWFINRAATANARARLLEGWLLNSAGA